MDGLLPPGSPSLQHPSELLFGSLLNLEPACENISGRDGDGKSKKASRLWMQPFIWSASAIVVALEEITPLLKSLKLPEIIANELM